MWISVLNAPGSAVEGMNARYDGTPATVKDHIQHLLAAADHHVDLPDVPGQGLGQVDGDVF